MTGSGWFDSAHGLQVYHFYPFTPLALRLGVVFYFLDVTAKVMLERERARLSREKHPTERQEQKLEEIREQLRKLNAQVWEESERDV